MIMAAGFPMLAAAILAGNIQAESAWKGQRTPWVLNDGAGTNKGLISWNRSRIVNAEKFLGKPLETATNAEQIKWIKEELRQYGLLDEFLNPNSTEDQLKRASYKYIGWGIEGDRWQQSSRIFAALQKGERGTYTPGMSSGMGRGNGNLNIAKKIAQEMNLQLTSFVRPGDPGYHGKGRAMDFQTVGSPGNRGTPSQLAYAQRMVSMYGSSLKQLIYTPLGFGIADGKQVPLSYWGRETNDEHYHHVHVAFAKGGRVSRPTKALIGEKGPEFIFDADTTKGLDQMMPNLLEHLNNAKNKKELSEVLRSYAGYENSSNQTIAVKLPPPKVIIKEVPVPTMNSGISIGGVGSDPFAGLAAAQ
jgi:hypothetical protein